MRHPVRGSFRCPGDAHSIAEPETMPMAQSHPYGTEVNDMILNPITQFDTKAHSHSPSERVCETKQEQTESTVRPGAIGNPEPPTGRLQSEHPRSTPTRSGRGCRRDCASWPGSSPTPTCGESQRWPRQNRHRRGGLVAEHLSETAPRRCQSETTGRNPGRHPAAVTCHASTDTCLVTATLHVC